MVSTCVDRGGEERGNCKMLLSMREQEQSQRSRH